MKILSNEIVWLQGEIMKFIKTYLSLLFLFVILNALSFGNVDYVCPICSNEYTARISTGGTSFGQRLDLKPLGSISAPWRVPQCTTCYFIQWQDDFTAEEIESLQLLVNSERYKELVSSNHSTYYLKAEALVALGKCSNEIGYTYLQASWQVEENDSLYPAYLQKAIEYYSSGMNDTCTTTATDSFTLGELYRLQSDFDKADSFFVLLENEPTFQRFPYNQLIPLERKLIRRDISSPRNVPDMQKTEEDLRNEPIYLRVETSALSEFIERYEIDKIFEAGWISGVDDESISPHILTDFILPEFPNDAMLELITDQDTIEMEFTTGDFNDVFTELYNDEMILSILKRRSRIRVRATGKTMCWATNTATILKQHLLKDGITTPDISRWVQIIIDVTERDMLSMIHPLGTDLFFIGRFDSYQYFGDQINSYYTSNNLTGEKASYITVVNSNGEVRLIEKDQQIIDNVAEYPRFSY